MSISNDLNGILNILDDNSNKEVSDDTICPLCEHKVADCICKSGNHTNKDIGKKMKVVFEHLYLFNDAQVQHIINLQKKFKINYLDKEHSDILEELYYKSKQYLDTNN